MSDTVQVPMPADVNRPDRLLLSLTARQVVILGGTGTGLWLAYQATASWVPLVVAIGTAVVVGGLAVALTLGRRDGVSLDLWLYAAIRHVFSRRRFTPQQSTTSTHRQGSCAGVVGGWRERLATRGTGLRIVGGHRPGRLRLPLRGISDDGVIDLGNYGQASVIDALPVNFSLRTGQEQVALIAAMGRWLNALDGPVQILIRSQRLDLTAFADQIALDANQLPDPELEAAAVAHAEFLDDLAHTREITHRQVLIVHRDTSGNTRRVASASAVALAGAELQPVVLNGDEVSAVLADCLDPYAPPPAPYVSKQAPNTATITAAPITAAPLTTADAVVAAAADAAGFAAGFANARRQGGRREFDEWDDDGREWS